MNSRRDLFKMLGGGVASVVGVAIGAIALGGEKVDNAVVKLVPGQSAAMSVHVNGKQYFIPMYSSNHTNHCAFSFEGNEEIVSKWVIKV